MVYIYSKARLTGRYSTRSHQISDELNFDMGWHHESTSRETWKTNLQQPYPREEIHRPSKTGGSQVNDTLLWPGADNSLQILFHLFQMFIGPKLCLLHAQLIKIAEVRSGCPKSIVVRYFHRVLHVGG